MASVRSIASRRHGSPPSRRWQRWLPGQPPREGTIPGVYISRFPTHDSWGTEFRVIWSADRSHFRIVSAGTDREFENPGEIDAGAAWGMTSLVSDPRRDIVFQDGVFLQAYRDAR